MTRRLLTFIVTHFFEDANIFFIKNENFFAGMAIVFQNLSKMGRIHRWVVQMPPAIPASSPPRGSPRQMPKARYIQAHSSAAENTRSPSHRRDRGRRKL